jgi:short-subunit dehydrogenase
MANERRFAVITGASSGIGLELAKCCATDGADVLIAADEPEIAAAADEIRALGGAVDVVKADLATANGVDALLVGIGNRPVDLLLANAGRGLGGAFLDQDLDDAQRVVDTNISGTIHLIHKVANEMRKRGTGKILITGSIAGFIPGAYQAVYNGTKAFLDSFAIALRNELKDTGISVTCLMPGATETEFFRRAGMMDTKIGASKKDDPADVAKAGYDAMMAGEADIVTGWKNKMQVAVAHVTPDTVLAEQHRKSAAPGTAKH